MHKNTLGGYERGTRLPDAQVLVAVAQHAGVSVEWLVTGRDPAAEMIAANEATMQVENVPLARIKRWLDEWWAIADPKRRAWLEIELERLFPELAEWQKKQELNSQKQSGA